jgi:hypothetical protein
VSGRIKTCSKGVFRWYCFSTDGGDGGVGGGGARGGVDDLLAKPLKACTLLRFNRVWKIEFGIQSDRRNVRVVVNRKAFIDE